MKNVSCLFLSTCIYMVSYSQVGIGTETPNPNSILDIVSEDKGILFTRLQLNDIDDTTTIPVASMDEGLIIYNLESSGTFPKNVSNDTFYFWDGSEWVALAKLSDTRKIIEEKNYTRIIFGGFPNETSESGSANYTNWKTLNFENEIVNVDDIYSEGDFSITAEGIYTFSGGVYFLRPRETSQGNKYYQTRILKNGTEQVATSSFSTTEGGNEGFAPLFWTSLLKEGDIIQVQYRMRVSNTGSDGNGTFGISPRSSLNISVAKKK